MTVRHITLTDLSAVARTAGYVNYNTVAKKLDRRLVALGATALCERGLGDDQHPNGYEAALDPWLRSLWSNLRLQHPLPRGLTEVRNMQYLKQPILFVSHRFPVA